MKLALTILFFIFVIACSSNTESETGTTNPPDTTTPTPGKTTFDSKISPLLKSKCAPCHTSGGQQTNFESFSTAKSKITEIIKRVELSPSDPGFMPKNRSKLSTSEIDQLKAWSSELSGS